MSENKPGLLSSEDWWSVWIGLAVFFLSLGALFGVDLLGWGAKFGVWLSPGGAIKAVSPAYKGIPAVVSILATYLFLLAIMTTGARFLGANVKRFAAGFSIIFAISATCWFLGHYAYIAATSDKLKGLGISWSLNLTGEAGFIIALVAGLVVGNFFPRLTAFLGEACRPEWYIKTAIVIMGAGLGVKAAQATCDSNAIMTPLIATGKCPLPQGEQHGRGNRLEHEGTTKA